MRWNRLISLLILALALTARLLPGPRPIDDSYITFRYARNLLAGEGFVYNPGERVLGTTTPLFTLVMASAGLLTGGTQAPFSLLALLISSAADGLTCLLLIQLGRHLGAPRAGLGVALAWAVAPFSVTFAIGGMETSLYVLLLTAAAWTHLTGRRIQAALLAALSLLTRPDALLLLVPLALDRALIFLKRFPRSNGFSRSSLHLYKKRTAEAVTTVRWELLAFLIPTLVWFTFATCYFGSPIPQSVAAKSLAYRLPPEAAFVRLLQHYATPFQEHLTLGSVGIGLGLLLSPFLFLAGALRSLRRAPRLWPFLAYPWVYFAAFSLANPLIFRWYLTPPLPAYLLGIFLGAEGFSVELEASMAHRFRLPRALPALLSILVILPPALLSLRGWQIIPDHGLKRPAPEMAWYQLELLYRQAADSLAPTLYTQPGVHPVLAAGDVGVLGFFTSARILDTVGLNSPISTRYYPLDPSLYEINYAIPPDLILDQQPDYIVIMEVYGRKGLLQNPRFWDAYRLRQKIPTDIYGSDGLLILERKPHGQAITDYRER